MDHENIGKGFKAFTIGVDVGKHLIKKFIKESGIDKTGIRFEEEFHKDKDEFVSLNDDFQICIVDKKLMLKRDVKKLMDSEELIPYKNNKKLPGIDKYTKN